MSKRKSGLPNNQEINQMSSDEIREHVKEYRLALMNYQGKVKGKQQDIDNPMMIRETKRTIARMITVLIRRKESVVGVRT